MGRPAGDAHHWMLCSNKRGHRPAVPGLRCGASRRAGVPVQAMEPSFPCDVMVQNSVRGRRRVCRFIAASGRGKPIVSVIPTKPSPAKPSAAKTLTAKPLAAKSPPTKPLPGERQHPSAHEGTPVPDSKGELPPLIRRTEVVAFALVGLLIICIIAGLYLAKAFFLPVTMAFIVGTMLSPAASFLERHRIPRSLAAVLIVLTAGAGVSLHDRPDRLARDGMEQQASGAGRAAEGKDACVRPAAGAVAGAARHARRLRHALDIPYAEVRLGAADTGIPVADLRRIPAVRRNADPVHRKLAGPAPGHDHEFRRAAGTAADAADAQRDRGASRQLPDDGDDDQCRLSASSPA